MGASSPESSHGFPASSRDGPRLPNESTPTPQCSARLAGPRSTRSLLNWDTAEVQFEQACSPVRTKNPGRPAARRFRLIGLFSVGWIISLPKKASQLLARLAEGVRVLMC